MQHGRGTHFAIALSVAAFWATPTVAQETWVIDLGETILSLDPQVFENHGVWAAVTGEAVGMEADGAGRELLTFLVDLDSDFAVRIDDNGVAFFEGSIRHVGGLTVGGPGGRRTLSTFVLRSDTSTSPHGFVTVGAAGERTRPGGLILRATNVEIDLAAGILLITGDDVRLSRPWAAALGRPMLAGESIGTFAVRARLVSLDGEEPVELSPSSPSPAGSVAGVIGPDLIVGILHSSLASWGTVSGISAFSIGTTSCNKGDEEVQWVSNTNAHPVIGQNMFRLKDDRFEQIGMSWLKHGFTALQMNACGFGCASSGTGRRLGVGCSDPYGAGLNGSYIYLGPKWEVNAHTGYFPQPPTRPPLTGDGIERRLQVHDVDLDPAQNAGAVYFAEGQYVAADEALAGNGNNSASYARISVWWDFDGGRYLAAVPIGSGTQREQPGIRAWQDTDPAVVETDVQIPGEGLFILAAKSVDQGDGSWRYDYALQNLNSDRSCGSFSVPLPAGALIYTTSFHDVDYHSGEPFDGTDWPAVVSDGEITWQTTDYAVNTNANALRWGTLYNFGFVANAGPAETTVTLGLFKPDPDDPDTAKVTTIGPIAVELIDCNDNGERDACDIDCNSQGCGPPCGESADCDNNGVPDECQDDCNENEIADTCDIRDETSNDCQPNAVPDECEADCDGDGIPDDCDPPVDCDGDGVEDCLDLCPCTSDPGACVCPQLGRCCFPFLCIEDYDHDICCAQGGSPVCPCDGSPCVAGCMLSEVDGDVDRDGDLDMKDTAGLLLCFSGPAEDPGFVEPSEACRVRFDFDFDTDIDHTDYKTFHSGISAPGP